MLKVLRAVVDVVGGRVGGRFNVPLVKARVEVGLVADDVDVGRFVVVVPEVGRLVVDVGLFLAGEVKFSFAASGLVTGSSEEGMPPASSPERRVESTGVAGAAFSASASG